MPKDKTAKDIEEIKEAVLKISPPEHFSFKDIIRSFIGASFLGFAFIFNTLLLDASKSLTLPNVLLIIILTIAILTIEIYFIGYSRIERHEERKFGQFWLKRITAFYLVAVLVSLMIVYTYGLDKFAGSSYNIFKLVVAVSLPCATGAAVADLLKKY